MIRGTTPTLVFNLPISTEFLTCIYITFCKQGGESIFEKTIDDCQCDGTKITLKLTQADTLLLDCSCKCEIQVRAKSNAGDAIASNIICCDVDRILKDGEI